MNQIHPAPIEFSPAQLAADPLLQYFHYKHLPPSLQIVSAEFCALAAFIVANVPRNPERTVALRKLLEAKDCAVRANVPEVSIADSFFDRLKRERKELDTKLTSLTAFIDTPAFAKLPEKQGALLREQQTYMLNYLEVLDARISMIEAETGQTTPDHRSGHSIPADVGDRDEILEARTTGGGSEETPVPFD